MPAHAGRFLLEAMKWELDKCVKSVLRFYLCIQLHLVLLIYSFVFVHLLRFSDRFQTPHTSINELICLSLRSCRPHQNVYASQSSFVEEQSGP